MCVLLFYSFRVLISDHLDSVSEISVRRCVINPDMGGDFCYPDSTSEEDAIKGKWVRVPRNLNLEGGYMSGWLVRGYSQVGYMG